MEMVDRLLSKPNISRQDYLNDRKSFQLLVISSLYMAMKISRKTVMGMADFAAVSGHTYSKEEIEATELDILEGLD